MRVFLLLIWTCLATVILPVSALGRADSFSETLTGGDEIWAKVVEKSGYVKHSAGKRLNLGQWTKKTGYANGQITLKFVTPGPIASAKITLKTRIYRGRMRVYVSPDKASWPVLPVAKFSNVWGKGPDKNPSGVFDISADVKGVSTFYVRIVGLAGKSAVTRRCGTRRDR